MSAFSADHSLEQYYMQQGQQQAAARAQQLHDGNLMQMAQMQQAARGQSSTSQNAAGGSPLTQAVAKAKALSMSSLDQDSLTDDQKQNLQALHDDPNTSFNAFNQAVGAVRQGQLSGQRQDNLEARQTAATARQASSMSVKQTQAKLQDTVAQQKAAQAQMKQADAALQATYAERGDAPGNIQNAADPNYNALRKAYSQGKQQLAAMQAQHESIINGMSDPEIDDHGTANRADRVDAMANAGYNKGTISITPAAPQQPAAATQPAPAAQGGKVDTFSQPAIKAGSKGKPTMDIIQQYHQRIGNNPDQIRAAMKAEGWSL